MNPGAAPRHDLRDVCQGLSARIHELAAELLPGGRKNGSEWCCGSLAGEAGRSLSVCLVGAKRGVWRDFATGEGGDAFDLVAQVHFAGDRKQAYRWAMGWLGLDGADDRALTTTRRAVREAAEEPRQDEHDAKRHKWAKKIWFGAEPQIKGTPVERYLLGRGIDLARLGRQPRALRYKPALYHRATGREWPAMVAAINDGDGRFVAVHRTWLETQPDGRVTKAPVEDPKMTLGSYVGGAIRLWRGDGARSLDDAAAGSSVVLMEGIEDGLILAMARPGYRYLAAVSVANMANIILPDTISTVILYLDNDGPNAAADKAIMRAIRRHREAGREVRVARPPDAYKDANALALGVERAA